MTLSKSLKTELYRKAIHLSSLWIPLFIWLFARNISIICFSFLLLGNLFMEYAAYKKVPVIGSLFRRMFFKTLRHKEVIQSKFIPSGSVYILAAALICSICYTKDVAAIAMVIVLISDTAAALFGKLFGSFRFENGKSLEGTLAFFVSAFIVLSVLTSKFSVLAIAIMAVLATFVEFYEQKLKIDDNLAIPLITGFVLNLFYV